MRVAVFRGPKDCFGNRVEVDDKLVAIRGWFIGGSIHEEGWCVRDITMLLRSAHAAGVAGEPFEVEGIVSLGDDDF